MNVQLAPHEQREFAMRLLAQGLSSTEVARRVGVSQQTIFSWAHGQPIERLTLPARGRPAALSNEQKRRLQAHLSSGATLAGFPTDHWTLQRVQIVVVREFGIHYSLSNVSTLLKMLGLGTDRSSEDRSLLRLEVSDVPLRKDSDGRSAAALYQFADHLPDAVMRCDLNFRRTYVNREWEAIAGVPAGLVLGKSLDEEPWLFESDGTGSQRLLLQVVQRVANSHEAEYIDMRATLSSGRNVDLQMRVLPEFDAGGRCVAVLVVIRNESVLADLRRQLASVECWLEELQRVGAVGYLSFDELGALDSISVGACLLLGRDAHWRPSLDAWVASFGAQDRDAVNNAITLLDSRRKRQIWLDIEGHHVQPAQPMRLMMQVQSRGRLLPRRLSVILRAVGS